jgi:hypothetical protein
MTEWQARIRAVFDESADGLAIMFSAARCRELWLHGEFYRQIRLLDRQFRVNTVYSGTQVDLLGVFPVSMVAEIKLFGLCGYEENCDKNLYQIRRDSERLLKIQSSADAVEEAYQLLVLETVGTPDRFGRKVVDLRFDTLEHEPVVYPSFQVRLWQYPRSG